MIMSSKIADRHLSRQACIYIRQSTMGQVRSIRRARRQYKLMTQATSLGWRPEQIRILDRDLGQSGATMTNREDFKVLVSDVAMGQVGAIFSLEASRLARSNQDWHRLLELCAITSTLGDRRGWLLRSGRVQRFLVLGMKGTFAQAELHIIRARLHGGKLNKAAKGELRFALPVGLVWDGDQIVLDPTRRSGAPCAWCSICSPARARPLASSNVNRTRVALPTPGVWRRLGWQADLGPADPFAGARRPGQSILCRPLCLRAIPIVERGRALRRDPLAVALDAAGRLAHRDPRSSRGLYLRRPVRHVNRGVWRPIAPIAKGSPVPCAKAFASRGFAPLRRLRSPSRRPLYRQWRPLPDLSMCVEAPRGFGTPRLPQCPVSAARSGHHGSLGQRHHAGDDRARAQR